MFARGTVVGGQKAGRGPIARGQSLSQSTRMRQKTRIQCAAASKATKLVEPRWENDRQGESASIDTKHQTNNITGCWTLVAFRGFHGSGILSLVTCSSSTHTGRKERGRERLGETKPLGTFHSVAAFSQRRRTITRVKRRRCHSNGKQSKHYRLLRKRT